MDPNILTIEGESRTRYEQMMNASLRQGTA